MIPPPIARHNMRPENVPYQIYTMVKGDQQVVGIKLACLTSFLYTAASRLGPSSVCFKKACKTETITAVSKVSRNTTKKTGTANTCTVMTGLVPVAKLSLVSGDCHSGGAKINEWRKERFHTGVLNRPLLSKDRKIERGAFGIRKRLDSDG